MASKEELLTWINTESATLAATKLAFKAELEKRGMTPTDVFSTYAGLIESITGGSVTVQDEKTVTFNGVTMEVAPDEGYDGIRKVILAGDPNLKSHNIVDAITMYGVTGSAKVAVSEDWPDGLPVTPEEVIPALKEVDPDAPDIVDELDYFVLVDNDGNITVGILYEDFELKQYDPVTTEIKALYWIRIAKHTTGEHAGTVTADDFRSDYSVHGGNYLAHIRACTLEKLYYHGAEVWPTAPKMYWYNSIAQPVLPEWDRKTYPYVAMLCWHETEDATRQGAHLYCSTVPLSFGYAPKLGLTRNAFFASADGSAIVYSTHPGENSDSVFVFKRNPDYDATFTEGDYLNTPVMVTPAWANYNVVSHDDESKVLITPSDPIPI